MKQFLLENYDLWRGLHLLAVIAWMAGLLYLPRLYAYHSRATPGSEMDKTFQDMERRLLKIIMTPAMTVAFVFGAILIYVRASGPGWMFFTEPWIIVKLLGVVFLAGFHGFLAKSRKAFAEGKPPKSERFWRMSNELPFLAAIVMVLAVTLEFGGLRD